MKKIIFYVFCFAAGMLNGHLYNKYSKSTQNSSQPCFQDLSLDERIAIVQNKQEQLSSKNPPQNDELLISPPFDPKVISALSVFEVDPNCIKD